MSALLLSGLACLLALGLQRDLASRRVRDVLIGDEVEYLARAWSDDPFGPHPFLRMPLLIVIVRALRGKANAAHLAMTGFSLTAVGVTALTSSLVGCRWCSG